MHDPDTTTRRAFIGGTAVATLALTQTAAPRAVASTGEGDDETFTYEVIRTEAEWNERLTEEEYAVMRLGGTEVRYSDPNWNRFEDGTYRCKGCNLTIYDSIWKVEVDIGWAFFSQSRENSVLMSIDGDPPDGMGDPDIPSVALIEAHCRRCGSHFGHILTVEGQTLHCINGSALNFQPATA